MFAMDKMRRCACISRRWGVCAVLAAIIGLVLYSIDLRFVMEIVESESPASAVPQDKGAPARQTRIEISARRCFICLQTQAPAGSCPGEHAVEMPPAGPKSRVGSSYDPSVVAQRADTSEANGGIDSDDDEPSILHLAQAAVDEAQQAVSETEVSTGLDD